MSWKNELTHHLDALGAGICRCNIRFDHLNDPIDFDISLVSEQFGRLVGIPSEQLAQYSWQQTLCGMDKKQYPWITACEAFVFHGITDYSANCIGESSVRCHIVHLQQDQFDLILQLTTKTTTLPMQVQNPMAFRLPMLMHALEFLPIPFFLQSVDGRIVYSNKYFHRLVGMQKARVRGVSIDAILDESLVKTMQEVDRRLVSGEASIRFEAILEVNGTKSFHQVLKTVFNRDNPANTEFICAFFDYTSQKELEIKLKEQQELYHLVVNHMLDSVFVYQNNRIIYVNNNMKDHIGYGIEQILNKPILEIVHPDDRTLAYNEMRNWEANKALSEQFLLRLIGSDGRIHFCEIHPFRIVYQGADAVLGIAHGITSQLESERRLKEMKEFAEEANRLKSRFLANMSHEIRTPMNGILGMTDLLGLSDLDADQTEMVTLIKHSARNLLNLINDILDLSRIEAGRVEQLSEPFSIHDVVGEVLSLVQVMCNDKRLRLQSEWAANIPTVIQGDSMKLRQVLLNLLGNAVKFTDAGFVSLKIMLDEITGSKCVLRFVVQDSGIGIPQEEYGKLFNEFSQIDDSHRKQVSGSGLGLAIVKRIVTMLNGRIEMESRVGEGSTFQVMIPYEIPVDSVNRPAETDEMSQFGHELRVLVVDDDNASRRIVEKIGQLNHWDIEAADNAEIGLRLFLTHRFDVVLLDIQMPKISGLDLLSRMRLHEAVTGMGKRTPVIAVTSYASPSDAKMFLEAGMDDYLAKPYRMEDLKRVVAKWTK